MSMSLVPPLNLGNVRYHLDRIRSSLLSIEHEATGHCLTGNAAELAELAKRLTDLCSPTKGHLTGGARAVEMKDAA